MSKLPLMLVSDARYGSHRRQDRRRNRRDNLHNTLKRYRYLFVFIWLYLLFYEILSLFQNNLLSLQNKNNEAMDEKTKEEQWMN